MFINGELVVGSGGLKADFQRVSPWSIGANDTDSVNSFQGMIADVRLYSRLLTDGEILDIYENIPEPSSFVMIFSLLMICTSSRNG